MIGGVILCLGDSITFGARDEYKRSYPAELSYMLSQKGQEWSCVNKGVCGETSAELLRRVYDEVKGCPDAFEVCLLTGTNDARDKVPDWVYERNISQILGTIVFAGKFVYLGLLPEKEGFGAPDYPSDMNRWLKAYNRKLEWGVGSCWQKLGIKLVDLRNLPVQAYVDGVHFCNKGYELIAKRFFDAIMDRRG